MNEVEAVKTEEDIQRITILLRDNFGQQFSDIWVLGLNLALRITDLLNIKLTDIEDGFLRVKEGKTDKPANIKLNTAALAVIERIQKEYPDNEYLFQSRSRNRNKDEANPITRQAVAKAFKEIGDRESVKVKLGTHSMRKTRGYMLFKKNGDITKVTKMLRHSSPSVTMRYIGITQEEIDQDFEDLVLG